MLNRTLDTQPVDYIENNFTLDELDLEISKIDIKKLIDKSYDKSTKI